MFKIIAACLSLVTSTLAVSEFYVECATTQCYDFGYSSEQRYLGAPSHALEFNNDLRYCNAITSYSCLNDVYYSGSPYNCLDQTSYLTTKFNELYTGRSGYTYWWDSGAVGCAMRGYQSGQSFTGDEYYRLVCLCDASLQPTGYWEVYYYGDSSCSTNVANSLMNLGRTCGSASSVSVSLFAALASVFAALKMM